MKIVGDVLSVSEIIKSAIINSDKNQREVAAYMGWTAQNFGNRLRNNTIDGDEWVKIAKFLGYEVLMKNSENGDVIKDKRQGIGERVVQMVNKTIYDTEKAAAICYTSEFAGSFFELYKDSKNGHFIVLYADWLNDGIIMPIDDEQAEKFMAVCKYKAGQ